MPFYDMLVMEQVLKFNIFIITAKKRTLVSSRSACFSDYTVWFLKIEFTTAIIIKTFIQKKPYGFKLKIFRLQQF